MVAIAAIFAAFVYWLVIATLNFLPAPRIVTFDHWWERHIVWEVNTTIERVDVSQTIDLTSNRSGRFSLTPDRRAGVSIFPGFTDWRDYEHLAFTLAVVNGADVDMSIRINDGERFRQYDGAFTHFLTATSEPTRVRIALTDLAYDENRGQLDLGRIRQITLTAARAPRDTILLLDEFRLE